MVAGVDARACGILAAQRSVVVLFQPVTNSFAGGYRAIAVRYWRTGFAQPFLLRKRRRAKAPLKTDLSRMAGCGAGSTTVPPQVMSVSSEDYRP